MNFARFGEANDYISQNEDYKFGIKLTRTNISNNINYSINSSTIPLNDSLMYFKDQQIK